MAIFLNSKQIDTSARFPDGTFAFRVPECNDAGFAMITWQYENEAEAMALFYLVKHLRREDQFYRIFLRMYYIPNARMDRTKASDEVFMLKYFADFINSLRFDAVEILDPHSHVSEALIDRVCVCPVKPLIDHAIQDIGDDSLVLFYPDEGAMKRYSDLIKMPYGFGVKHRDWRTGKIKGLKIEGTVDFDGKTVLIVDDICCRGGTFYHSAKALKEAGAKRIFLYCTHCEHTIFSGELPSSDMIDGIYTTDSIFKDYHHKIAVLDATAILTQHVIAQAKEVQSNGSEH